MTAVIADAEFLQIAARVIGSLAHPQPGDAKVLLDIDVPNSLRREKVRHLLVQERSDAGEYARIGLLKQRERMLVIDDLQNRKRDQEVVGKNAGPDQPEMILAVEAALKRPELAIGIGQICH